MRPYKTPKGRLMSRYKTNKHVLAEARTGAFCCMGALGWFVTAIYLCLGSRLPAWQKLLDIMTFQSTGYSCPKEIAYSMSMGAYIALLTAGFGALSAHDSYTYAETRYIMPEWQKQSLIWAPIGLIAGIYFAL